MTQNKSDRDTAEKICLDAANDCQGQGNCYCNKVSLAVAEALANERERVSALLREAVEKRKEVYLTRGMGAIGGWNQMSHGYLDALAAIDKALKEINGG